jgi:hypothetical protein
MVQLHHVDYIKSGMSSVCSFCNQRCRFQQLIYQANDIWFELFGECDLQRFTNIMVQSDLEFYRPIRWYYSNNEFECYFGPLPWNCDKCDINGCLTFDHDGFHELALMWNAAIQMNQDFVQTMKQHNVIFVPIKVEDYSLTFDCSIHPMSPSMVSYIDRFQNFLTSTIEYPNPDLVAKRQLHLNKIRQKYQKAKHAAWFGGFLLGLHPDSNSPLVILGDQAKQDILQIILQHYCNVKSTLA